MNKKRIAINGFGRIGRAFFRMAYDHPTLEIVAINDLGDIKNLAYLLEYDTVYGRTPYHVESSGDGFLIDGKKIRYTSEKELDKLPWKDERVDVVIESTGAFTTYEKTKGHLDAGAKRVVLSAPAKDNGEIKTILMGVNESELKECTISSNASCTTNATSPLIGILDEAIGIEKAILSTIHAYTASQAIVDGLSKKDFREGRAGGQNIVPSSTGAALATTLAYPNLKNKFDGISIRVPVPVGSIVDVTFIAKRSTTVEEVNKALVSASKSDRWKNIFAVTNDPLVSSDIIGAQFASIADLLMTRVVDGNLVKVLAWYDNEMSYTAMLVAHVEKASLVSA